MTFCFLKVNNASKKIDSAAIKKAHVETHRDQLLQNKISSNGNETSSNNHNSNNHNNNNTSKIYQSTKDTYTKETLTQAKGIETKLLLKQTLYTNNVVLTSIQRP